MSSNDKIYEAKVTRENGMLSVTCSCCQRKHYGNALEGFLRSGALMSCSDGISSTGCGAKLRLLAA